MADIRNGNNVGADVPSSEGSNYGAPVQGTDSSGRDVTASFGISGSSREGETLVSDGHKSGNDFMQSNQHDHYDGSGGGKDRGQYSGGGDDGSKYNR